MRVSHLIVQRLLAHIEQHDQQTNHLLRIAMAHFAADRVLALCEERGFTLQEVNLAAAMRHLRTTAFVALATEIEKRSKDGHHVDEEEAIDIGVALGITPIEVVLELAIDRIKKVSHESLPLNAPTEQTTPPHLCPLCAPEEFHTKPPVSERFAPHQLN